MNHECDLALPELLAPWLTRRSIGPKHLADPGPDVRELECLLRAAFTGPDHARLGPCRLKPLGDGQRERLATAFQNYRREADGGLSLEDAGVERRRALRGPCPCGSVGVSAYGMKTPLAPFLFLIVRPDACGAA